jgi:menaquinone-specific isochorismate synthase
VNLFHWLAEQLLFPKVYYCDKESGIERAAVGALRTFTAPPHEDTRCYGGLAFPSCKQGTEWDSFGTCRFWQPVQEIVQEAQDVSVVDIRYRVMQVDESVTFTDFTKQIDFLKQQEVEKVVLARRRSLTLSSEPSVWTLLSRIKAKSRNATVFGFQMNEKHAFFGASPETFFRRKRCTLAIDAVAGSGRETLGEKEKQEFEYVKRFIQSAAMPFATRFHWHPEDQLLKTTHVHHLYNTAHLNVNADFSDAAFIQALHPTPAVGGVGRDKALALIEALEPFKRGWYAAPIGFLSQDETHLCVGLRCALLCANQLHVYAGAGIVSESVPKNEWDEIDQKMRLVVESL